MSTKAELQRRIEELEQAQFQRQHTHTWRCSKAITTYPADAFNPGRHVFYSWECVDEKCDYGSGGTNAVSRVPDFFPADLR